MATTILLPFFVPDVFQHSSLNSVFSLFDFPIFAFICNASFSFISFTCNDPFSAVQGISFIKEKLQATEET